MQDNPSPRYVPLRLFSHCQMWASCEVSYGVDNPSGVGDGAGWTVEHTPGKTLQRVLMYLPVGGTSSSLSLLLLLDLLSFLPLHPLCCRLQRCLSRFRIEWWLRPRRSHSNRTYPQPPTAPARAVSTADPLPHLMFPRLCPRHTDRDSILSSCQDCPSVPVQCGPGSLVSFSPSKTLHGS